MTVEEIETRFDVDLAERDIQALASVDELAAFFARLGYDTNARTVQTPGNLGIASESTLRPIKRIELIADREGLFQVYLFELTSVTVAHTRALARAFRNRVGNFLLVLTSDYERLDFVLLERYLPPAASGSTIGERQVGIRPRTLTVERRNPGRRALRVLKRLTWTETDGFAQYDKLLAVYAVADWAEEHFNNRALFSDYYLLERLREFPEWRNDPKPAFTALRALYRGTFERFARKSVAELRTDLMEPVLAALGFEALGGKAGASHETPDYRLRAPGAKEDLAWALAYPWARSLDGKDEERDGETPDENPGAIVVSLLERNVVPWVIVTNGRLWRLYARQTHSRASNYYELDAEELLADTATPLADPGEAFRYFWLLFRRQAFEKHPTQREGRNLNLSLLDRLLLESEDYARDLGSRLKDRVFDDVFPHLVRGFVEHLRAQGGPKSVPQTELNAIYQGTLTLLYRLLFLLFAEARDLLPVREVRGYWEASVARIKKEVADHAGEIHDEVGAKLKKAYRDDEYGLWNRLQRLFAIVDRGDAALNVPFYNGGLFLTEPGEDDETPEAVAARFLTTHKVADRDLARALDLLSRTVDDKRHSLVSIDYKSLGVRQLGSIYEGLLEFKVRIAAEKLAIAKEKGREVYASFANIEAKARERAERVGRVVKKGAVYLENDKRERKASGSYYTPDYIVEYIIEHAVGPMLIEKFNKMRPKMRAAQADRKAFFDKQKALEARRISPEPAEKAERIGEELVSELFDVKVLDPAMGSGHFLVEAVDFTTDCMLTFLNAFPWNPVQAYLARTRGDILAEAERQSVTLDPSKLTDVNLLKRHVLKRCIYGVDLNPMAVELAKVSLWLDCFTLGAPLSFLDHHLRCGNSLIGITEKQFEESQERWGQMDLLGGSQYAGAKIAVGAMIAIGALPDITPAQTQESRKQYGIAAEALAPVKRLFDVYASQWFGNQPRKVGRGKGGTELNRAFDFLRDPLCAKWSQSPAKAKLPDHFRGIADTALDASAKYRFFHWELEFPEVFFGPRPGTELHIERLEGAGFDAVVGNPPYVSALELGQLLTGYEKPYWKECFPSAKGAYDLYILFIDQALQLARTGGRTGLITPNKYLSAPYAEALRTSFLLHGILERLVDLSRVPVFEDPSVYPLITISRRAVKRVRYDFDVERVTHATFRSMETNSMRHSSDELSILPEMIWGFLVSDWLDVILKASGESITLEQCALVNASTSAAEADAYETAIVSRGGQRRRKFVNTGLIDRYVATWGIDPLTHKGVSILTPFLDESSAAVSDERKRQYASPKIIVAKMSRRLEAMLDVQGEYASANTNFVYGDDTDIGFLTAILNSRAMAVLYEGYFGALRMSGGYLQIQAPQLRVLPIPKGLLSLSRIDERGRPQAKVVSSIKSLIDQDPQKAASALRQHLSADSASIETIQPIVSSLAFKLVSHHEAAVREKRRFLDWLEATLKIKTVESATGLEVLRGKARIRSYVDLQGRQIKSLTSDGLVELLEANKSRCGRSIDDRALRQRLIDEFEKSKRSLTELYHQSLAMDEVIDVAVCRLFAFSDAQIARIEAAGPED
jgi:hypothetical protein